MSQIVKRIFRGFKKLGRTQKNMKIMKIMKIITGQKITGQLARYSPKHSIYLYLGHYGTGDYWTARNNLKKNYYLCILNSSERGEVVNFSRLKNLNGRLGMHFGFLFD